MDPRIQSVVYLIESNFASPLKGAEMARSVGLSVSRLQHIFKDETGETMKKYQQRLRMARASELLLSTHMSVKEVVAAVGAPDKSHFLRQFTNTYGLSPRRYRMHSLYNRTEGDPEIARPVSV